MVILDVLVPGVIAMVMFVPAVVVPGMVVLASVRVAPVR